MCDSIDKSSLSRLILLCGLIVIGASPQVCHCFAEAVPTWQYAGTACHAASSGTQPPALKNPFGPRPTVREDAVPGYVEMSDGKICHGQVYLTRDARLKIHDRKLQRQREVPLRVVKQIECRTKKEWMEKEWRFKELAADEKFYTGRTYPAREYVHTITLRDGRTITGPLSAIVYVKPGVLAPPRPGEYQPNVKTRRFFLHKRDKGKIGTDLKSFHYVRLVKLGKEALEEGKRKAAAEASTPGRKR